MNIENRESCQRENQSHKTQQAQTQQPPSLWREKPWRQIELTMAAIVVSWNHRHMANERKRSLFVAVNRLAGYEQELRIHTPFEVIQ